MIPAYLGDLQLPRVFVAYTTKIEKYIYEATEDKHIVDAETCKVSGLVSPTFGQAEDAGQKFFAVENRSRRPYSLIQIDNAVIKTPQMRKCDCLVANDKYLCFIEFKANAVSPNPSVIERNYRKAIDQIETTMSVFRNYFKAQGTDFRKLRSVEAYICLRSGYPKITSSQMNYQIAFAQTNGGIPLSFARKKVL